MRGIPHPAMGIRLPDIVVPPILKAFKLRDVAGTLMLSYHRETAPTDVIESGKYVFLGHTGTSIREYVSKASKYADGYGVIIEVEADHVSLMSSPERAIKRITGGGFEYGLSDEEIKSSLNYIEREFKEVAEVGGVDFVTIDTCELIDLGIDGLSKEEIMSRYESEIDEGTRRELERRYVGRRFKFFLSNGELLEIKFSIEDVARLSLKFLKSIEYVPKVVDVIRKYLSGREFGIEVALDEVPQVTKPKEMLFYLSELSRLGIDIDFVAPNVGFKKREDFIGDLSSLKGTIDELNAIAKSFGALISFHSGSGAHPYSDKGVGTWYAIREVTGGAIKYKVSGVYIQLLLEVMSRFPNGSEVRKLYEEIFDAVLNEVRRYVRGKVGLYSPHLEEMLRDYEVTVSKDPSRARDPRANFFRHYFFLFQALMDSRGVRYLREKLLDLYSRSEDLRREYEREATELTLRIIDKLGFQGNYVRYRVLTT